MRKTLLTFSVMALLATAAAPAYANGNAELLGLLGGGVAGGIIGNQFGHGTGRLAATAGGAFLGAWAGDRIGYSVDNAGYGSTSYASAPVNYSPYYAPVYTPNYVAPPAPSPAAYAGPQPYADTDSGTYCREITQRVRVGGQIQESYGTACLQPDGSWRIVQ